MDIPKTLVQNRTNCELIAATYHNNQSVRLKAGSCPKEVLPEGAVGTDWVYIRQNSEVYQAPPFYKPVHGKVLHRSMHLFLRDYWPRYKRVDDYLKDVFFFDKNREKAQTKTKQHDTKTVKNYTHQ